MIRRVILAVLLLMRGRAHFSSCREAEATARISARPLLYLLADAPTGNGAHTPGYLSSRQRRGGNEGWQRSGPGIRAIHKNSFDLGQRQHHAVSEPGGNGRGRACPAAHHPLSLLLLEENNYWVNACALPGGYVIVGRGLFDLLQSEDELAAVLGHEIAHVDNRHAIERLQYDLASKKLGLEEVYQLGETTRSMFFTRVTQKRRNWKPIDWDLNWP